MVWQMAHGDAHCDADAPDEEDVDRASRLSALMQKSSAQCQALGGSSVCLQCTAAASVARAREARVAGAIRRLQDCIGANHGLNAPASREKNPDPGFRGRASVTQKEEEVIARRDTPNALYALLMLFLDQI